MRVSTLLVSLLYLGLSACAKSGTAPPPAEPEPPAEPADPAEPEPESGPVEPPAPPGVSCARATEHVVALLLDGGTQQAQRYQGGKAMSEEDDKVLEDTRAGILKACETAAPAATQLECVLATKLAEELWRCDPAAVKAAAAAPAAPAGVVPTLDQITVTQALALYGEPSKKERVWEMGVDGSLVAHWEWPAAGFQASVEYPKAQPGPFWVPPPGAFWVADWGPLMATQVICSAPCTLKTDKGLGLGSTVAQVKKAHGKEISKRDSTAERLIAGSLYGGTFFTIQDGKVFSIFIGNNAE